MILKWLDPYILNIKLEKFVGKHKYLIIKRFIKNIVRWIKRLNYVPINDYSEDGLIHKLTIGHAISKIRNEPNSPTIEEWMKLKWKIFYQDKKLIRKYYKGII
jgi:hypothetical protein